MIKLKNERKIIDFIVKEIKGGLKLYNMKLKRKFDGVEIRMSMVKY